MHQGLKHPSSSPSSRAAGSGLGLANVQKIVGDHDETIAVRNSIDGGGIVEIRLPVK